MKIKNLLYLLPVISTIVVGILVGITFVSANEVISEIKLANDVDMIERGFSDLNKITYDYLLRHEKRTQEQWHLKFDSLLGLIDGQEKSSDILKSKYVLVKNQFIKTVENYEQEIEGFESGSIDSNKNRHFLSNQYGAELLREIQSLEIIASDLATQAKNNAEKAEYFQRLTIIISVILLVFLIIVLSLIIGKRIINSLRILTITCKKITDGNFELNLNHIKKDDEIGELATQFDLMLDSVDTSKKKMALEQSKYRNLYEHSPALLRTINMEGIILDCNQSYFKTLGYTKDEVMGKSLFNHISDKSMVSARESFETWKNSGRILDHKVWLKKKDGSVFPSLILASNIYDQAGKLIGSNTMIRDISDVYMAMKSKTEKDALKIKMEHLKKNEKLKDEFLSMTSHELKTPLTPIMGWCDALKDPDIMGNLTEDQCDAVNAIESNVTKLRTLIDDLLDIQKLELQQMKFKNEDVNVDIICKQINDDFGFLMKEKQAQLIISKDKIPIFKSDEGRISQVLSALLSNAVDYIPEKDGRIDVNIKEMNNQIIFSIKDNGIGISKENQKLLFKKFYQIDTSHTRKHGGTGLGLAICKGIVDGLGGKIWVESDVGKETIFYFSLPLKSI